MGARFHADYETADRIVAGLTVRQLLVLSITGLGVWGLFLAVSEVASTVLAGIVCAPIGALGAVLVAKAPDGTPMDRFLYLAVRHLIAPNRLVLAPQGLAKLALRSMGRVGVVDLPVRAISEDGSVDVCGWGISAVMKATAINLQLRSESERKIITDSFGRLCNSLDAGVQVLVSARPIDAEAIVADIEREAAFLPHPALTESAHDYCRYFRSLISGGDVLRHEVFVCIRESKKGKGAAVALERRAQGISTFLRDSGIPAERLQSGECEGVVSRAMDPHQDITEGSSR